jgi:hypothetical protein
MTFEKAKQEFGIRYYLWAISEWEKEINESFPNLRSFKTGAFWETYQVMLQLDKSQQLTLAHGLLKKFHPEAVKALGESCSTDEESLRWRRDNFFRIKGLCNYVQRLEKNNQLAEARNLFQKYIYSDAAKFFGENYLDDEKSLRSRLDTIFNAIPSSLEEQIAERKRAGEKIKFTSKRKLLKRTADRFQEAFGSECVETDRVLEGDPSLAFEMKCCGWILTTHFWFGHGASLINYSHSIASEISFEQQGQNGTYMGHLVLASFISFSAWLGITSQIEWEYLKDENVEAACDEVIKYCRHFVAVLPKLLKGLEFEKITLE